MAQNYVLLERIELNASAASVTFSNIPQSGYTDLKIVMSARSDLAAVNGYANIRFNSNSSNLSQKTLEGTGSAASSSDYSGYLFTIVNGASSTSNTFGNCEIYVPNYTSANAKSISVDVVNETNATSVFSQLAAGLWNNTSAITSVTLSAVAGNLVSGANFVQYSTFSLYGLAAVGTTPVIAPKASGGNITTDGTYWYHTFLATNTFTPFTNLTCDALVVAGGGGGGNDSGGGGGAGGLLGFVAQSFANATSYAVTVGAGGVGSTSVSTNGAVGSDSQLGALTLVKGGGFGGSVSAGYLGVSGDGAPGGSGGAAGGGATSSGPHVVGTATSGQGNNGGLNFSTGGGQRSGGGGGGAGAVGGNGAVANVGGAGGNGSSAYSSYGSATLTGENVSGTYYYAGGGGGTGATGFGVPGGAGGYGGGAAGNNSTVPNGTVNTGGGGGATGGSNAAGTGGSGIVIIRYTIA